VLAATVAWVVTEGAEGTIEPFSAIAADRSMRFSITGLSMESRLVTLDADRPSR
jgi:hypothetical protein